MNEKNKDQTAPLIFNDPEKCPPVTDTWKTIKDISHFAMWPIIGQVFHPIYSVVNAAVVGRFDDDIYLSALGLGSLTVGILILSINSCFALVIGSFVSPAFGDDRLDLAKRYLYRQFVLNTLVFIATIIPTFWIYDFFILIG